MVASVFMLAAIIWLYTHNPQHNFEYTAFRDVIAHGGFSSPHCNGCSSASLLPLL